MVAITLNLGQQNILSEGIFYYWHSLELLISGNKK